MDCKRSRFLEEGGVGKEGRRREGRELKNGRYWKFIF